MSPRNRVLIVGSYNQDHVWRMPRFPAPGETVLGGGFATGAGGKGFNQATAAARLGAATTFIGACGNDPLGRLAQRNAKANGIDGHWQVLDDAATGTAAILVDANGQNEIIVAPGANAQLGADFIRARGADFKTAGVLLLQLETNFEALDAALASAARHDVLRILNPAPFDPALDAALLSRCDLLTPNETEFAQLLAQRGETRIEAAAVPEMDDPELHALCRKLAVSTVIVTLGARGCFVSHAAEHPRLADARDCYRVAAPRVDAIDTTGAGDAFNGALAAALVRQPDAPLARCVEHASQAAALSTERRGAAAAMVDGTTVAKRFGGTNPPVTAGTD